MMPPQPVTDRTLPVELSALLARLRRRIRWFVWLQGLSLGIAWLGLTFWCGLALDYLPVLAGIGEMPRGARVVLLAAIGLVLAWILYRWVFRRGFVRLADRNLALLLERRFAVLGESLITAVELGGKGADDDSPQARHLLDATIRQAVEASGRIDERRVLNPRPVTTSVAAAVVLTLTIGVFYVVNAQAWELWVGRLYLLRNDPWPRNARIEVVGVELRERSRSPLEAGLPEEPQLLEFRDGRVKVAKGSNLGLLVRADAGRRVVPEICVVQYQTADGDYGRLNMTRIGRIRDQYQHFRYEGKPFEGVLSDVQFDVIGYDHRVAGFQLQVVDSPEIVEVQADCQFPAYLVDEQLSQWQPRTIDLRSGIQLPRGTRLQIRARSSKPLSKIVASNPDTRETVPVTLNTADPFAVEYTVEHLADHLTLDLSLTDQDGVRSERPYRIHLAGIEDAPPIVDMHLRGIGTAVTPNVIIPLTGKITDDYGLGESLLEVALNEGEPQSYPLAAKPTGEAEFSLDFRSERGKPDGQKLEVGAKLQLVVQAADRRDLGDGPNRSRGDRYQLDVVAPEQLLTLLEARELALRRRLEQIITELAETRDMVVRVQTEGPAVSGPNPVEPSPAGSESAAKGATAKEPVSPDAAAGEAERLKRIWSLRLLRTQQTLLQSQKSAQEVLGVAESFQEIFEELVNNRVDTEDRKVRLRDQVAGPLREVAAKRFPELEQSLEKLSGMLAAIEAGGQLAAEDPRAVAAAQQAAQQVEQILRELEQILQRMLDLEDFNELLDLVRGLIEDQERVSAETKKEQKKSILDLLK